MPMVFGTFNIDGKEFFYNPSTWQQSEQSFDSIYYRGANGFWYVELDDKELFYSPPTNQTKEIV